jgi:hypothetical protein
VGKYFSIRVGEYSVNWHRKAENLAKMERAFRAMKSVDLQEGTPAR